jgi:hypothetical protein
LETEKCSNAWSITQSHSGASSTKSSLLNVRRLGRRA